MKNLLRVAMILCAAALVLQPVFLQYAHAVGNQCEQPEEPEGGGGGGTTPGPEPLPDPGPGDDDGGGGGGSEGDPGPGAGDTGTLEIVFPVEYRDDNPETIDPGGAPETISVEGGEGPYTWSVNEGDGYSFETSTTTGSGGSSNTLTADVCAQKPAEISITDANGRTADGIVESTYVPLEYDPGNPEIISREIPTVFSVIGGGPPYTWTISGSDFWLVDSEGAHVTTLVTNSPYASVYGGPTSCFATLTIDSCVESVTGNVKIPGQWVNIEFARSGDPACNVTGSFDTVENNHSWIFSKTSGRYKVVEDLNRSGEIYEPDWSSCATTSCINGSFPELDACNFCLEYTCDDVGWPTNPYLQTPGFPYCGGWPTYDGKVCIKVNDRHLQEWQCN